MGARVYRETKDESRFGHDGLQRRRRCMAELGKKKRLRLMPGDNIESEFPRLRQEGYSITSSETDDYNCIAWAGGETSRKWDPDPASGRYWPESVPRTLDIDSFVQLFALKGGYSMCDNDAFEHGFEKIAIFVNVSKEVTHAARQLTSGAWSSKLGDWEDIEHNTLSGLESSLCGKVAIILKRRRFERIE